MDKNKLNIFQNLPLYSTEARKSNRFEMNEMRVIKIIAELKFLAVISL